MEHLSTREKMKNMTRKEKIEYIWHYYRFHILTAIVVTALLSYTVIDVMKTTEVWLNVTMFGQSIDTTKVTGLQEKINTELVKDKKQEMMIAFIQKTGNLDPQFSLTMNQKLQASIAAKDIDVLVVDKSDFEGMASQGIFMKLSTVRGLNSLNLPEDAFVRYKQEEYDTKEEIYGISAKYISGLNQLGYDTEDKILGIVANTERLDRAVKLIKWLTATEN